MPSRRGGDLVVNIHEKRRTSSRPRTVTRLAPLALLGALLATPASAQNVHHQTLAFGDRALGMGGAFTGLATDHGAAWYNPAGLAFLETDAISGSFLLHAFENLTFEGDELRLETTRRPTFPLYATGVVGIGPRDHAGRHRHAVGIVVVRPLQQRRRLEAQVDPAAGMPAEILIDRVHHLTWFGPSWASQLTPRFGFGASLLATVSTFEHREVLLGTGADGGGSVRSTLTEVKSNHLVLRMGGLYVGRRTRFGFMLQLPGLALREQGIIKDLRALPGRTPFFAKDENVAGAFPIPAELRLGVSTTFGANDRFVFAADLQLVSETPSRSLVDLPAIADAAPGQAAAAAVVDLDTAREGVVNAAIGREWKVRRDLLFRFGVTTDLSAARPLPASSDRFQEERIPSIGGSGSIGTLLGDLTELNIGIAAVTGEGEAMVLDPRAGLGTPRYTRVRATRRVVTFFISGRLRRPTEGETPQLEGGAE